MSEINLVKAGERVDLTKNNLGLKIAAIGLGWDVNSSTDAPFDLDAFCIAAKDGKMPNVNHLCFFNNKTILSGSISHSGDNLTGEGSGDDETIVVKLSEVSQDVNEVLICVNIYEAAARGQNFGKVNNAFCRVYDQETKQELVRFDLTEDYSAFNGMIMGKLYRKDGEWKFQAVGTGANGNITEIAQPYMSATA